MNFRSARELTLTRGGLLDLRGPLMTATDSYRYRGYEIVPLWQWSSWCAGVYATRADLPILARSTLATMAEEKEEAVAEAKHCIDRLLAE